MNWSSLGLVPYDSALDLQKRLQSRRIREEIPDQVLALEHPPVITVGASPDSRNGLHLDSDQLEKRGIQLAEVRRGGHLTYHGPGQLVLYPIVELEERDLRSFLRQLEELVIRTLDRFDLRGEADGNQAGVRVGGKKIASIGIQVSRWVNRHGVALNVDMDLSPFEHFTPCDVPGERLTTMEEELRRAPMMKDVEAAARDAFEEVFERSVTVTDETEPWDRAYEDMPEAEQRKLRPKRGGENRAGEKPPWIRAKVPGGKEFEKLRSIMDDQFLNTVCEEASCPNLGECWSRGTATFMILGDTCTRACGFCDVKTGTDLDLDEMEPYRVARATQQMDLEHTVITSVNRDDLPDGGASIWAETIEAVRELNPDTSIEVLIPDLMGDWKALQVIFDAEPDILNHNLETVPRLYPSVRPKARYERSLELLSRSREVGFPTKSGIMLGIGERTDEIRATMEDLYDHGVRILTMGQYLRPDDRHLPVDRWVHPEEFDRWAEVGKGIGFNHVESGPLVRSSYHADEQVPAELTPA